MPYLLASLLVSALIGGGAMLATDALVADLGANADANASLTSEAGGSAASHEDGDMALVAEADGELEASLDEADASDNESDGALRAGTSASVEAEAEGEGSLDFDLLSELGLEF